MSDENTFSRSLPGRYRTQGPLLILIGLLLAVGGAVATLPGVATWQITTQLERLCARSVAMEKVVINPAIGEITVTRFNFVGSDGEDITVCRAHIQISLSAPARRQISI
jgi:stage V sporulation protein SpoVS